jgi:hypothetical protein
VQGCVGCAGEAGGLRDRGGKVGGSSPGISAPNGETRSTSSSSRPATTRTTTSISEPADGVAARSLKCCGIVSRITHICTRFGIR